MLLKAFEYSYKDHVTNEEVHGKTQTANREYDELLTLVTEVVWPGPKVF